MARALSLRGKSILALATACLLSSLLAGVIGQHALTSIRHYLGTALTRNLTLLNRERLLAPVQRELALSMRLARSQTVREWFLDEQNATKKRLAFREAEDFRQDFADHSYFLISALSNRYYFNDAKSAFSAAPRYRLLADAAKDAWFFGTMKNTDVLNINVDIDVNLGLTKIWFNVIVKDGSRKIGLAGSGLDLSAFLHNFASQAEPGVTPMVIDKNGAIQVHPDGSLIAYNSATNQSASDRSLFGLLDNAREVDAAHLALGTALERPGEVQLFEAKFQGKPQILALAFIPELQWYVVIAADLAIVQLVDLKQLLPASLAAAVLLLSLVLGFGIALNRLVLRPLFKLTLSARAIASGDYNVALPPSRRDEIGDLTDAFALMVSKVQRHTEELEQTVAQRTQELLRANREMAAAHKQIHDSIAYASLIQQAILPERQMASAFSDEYFVLWRPRDIVGGDFYVFRQDGDGYLLGVADCAGHGVAGAFMTMLAYAAVNQAIGDVGLNNPSGILAHTGQAIRAMLGIGERQQDIATQVDAGFAYVDRAARTVTFSGAKIALYWSDGQDVGSLKGARRALGERQEGQYGNETCPLHSGHTFYLTTDGYLDQSGGEKGYGLGGARFAELLRRHARQTPTEQKRAFEAELMAWQGSHPQRDDITVVCFHFPDSAAGGRPQ